MKIKATYPVIFVDNPKRTIEFYEKYFGYQVSHINQDILNDDVEFTMDNGKDRISIIQTKKVNDATGIKVITDDLLECLSEYQKYGYEIIDGGNNDTSKAIYLKDKNKYIVLMNHIK